MREIIIPILCLISFGNCLSGQTSGYSIGIAGGCAGGVIRGSFGTRGSIESHNNSYTSDQTEPALASLGKGYDLQINIFKAFKRNIGVGLGTNFHKGSPVTMDLTSSSHQFWNGNYSHSTTKSTTTYNNISQVQFNPFFKISSRDTVNTIRRPYVKFGFLVGCFGKTSKEINARNVYQYSLNGPPPYKDTTVTSSSYTITDYKGGISFGYANAVGFDFTINEHLLLLTECDFNFMQWKPKKIKEPNSNSFTYISDPHKTYWAYSSLKFKIGLIYKFKR